MKTEKTDFEICLDKIVEVAIKNGSITIGEIMDICIILNPDENPIK